MDWQYVDVDIKDPILKDELASYIFEIGCLGGVDLDVSKFNNLDTKHKEEITMSQGFRIYFDDNVTKDKVITSLSNFYKLRNLEFQNSALKFSQKQKNINWREFWKESYHPLKAGVFEVVPSWISQEEDDRSFLIKINPKMAFGTGTHETTQLMLEMITKTEMENKFVLDAGCGSGILSIASLKKGASVVDGIDIDNESIENSLENAKINNVDEFFRVSLASEETYSQRDVYDVVMANINKNVLLNLLPDFCKVLKVNGLLILSGLLLEDYKIIKEAVSKFPLEKISYKEKGEWCSLKYQLLS